MKILRFFNSVIEVIVSFITLISMLLSTNTYVEPTYEPKDPNKLIASFSVISDVHTETTNSASYKNFISTLKGMKSGTNVDAAIFLGDNVMNGQYFENLLFYSAVKKIMPSENNLVALGNHDIGNGKGDYSKLCNNFLDLNEEYLGNKNDKPYYYKVINGCYLIFLATEDLGVHECYISEQQKSWLFNILDEADAKKAPILLFNHYPLLRVEGEDWYIFAEKIGNYDNLLYICGHTHMPLDTWSFRNYLGVKSIYLPRSGGSDDLSGIGFVFEIYENQILIRPRNLLTNEWIPEFERMITYTK